MSVDGVYILLNVHVYHLNNPLELCPNSLITNSLMILWIGSRGYEGSFMTLQIKGKAFSWQVLVITLYVMSFSEIHSKLISQGYN